MRAAAPGSSAPRISTAGCVCGANNRSKAPRHRCKVAFAREHFRDPSLHDQAHSVSESLVAKSHECALHFQPQQQPSHHSQQGAGNSPRSKHVTSAWRGGSNGSSGGGGGSSDGSSGSKRSWPWSLWGPAASSTPATSATAAVAAASSTAALVSTSSHLGHSSAPADSRPDDVGGSSGSSGSSTWDQSAAALITIPPQDTWEEEYGSSSSSSVTSSSSSDSSQLFLYDLMPPAAAKAVAVEPTNNDTRSRLALLLGDTYPKALTGTGSSSGSSPAGSSDSQDTLATGQQHRRLRQQWGLNLPASGAVHAVPLPSTAALQRSLKAVGAPPENPSSSHPAAGVARSSRSQSSSDDADWLTAVLSAPTSRLSSHSNAVLTNSLKRLASLRSTSGGLAAAAGVDGTEGLLDSIRARFDSFQLQQFEEVAQQLAQLRYTPEPAWMAAFERSSLEVMPGGSPRLISRLLLSRSKLPGPVSSKWCAACCTHMAAAPQKLSVSSWVNALYALVRLKHTPDRQFQVTFFSATAERLDDVSPELLTHLVWSLSRLQLAPSYMWWRSLVRATAGIEKPFSQAQLASLLHSVALWAGPGGIAAQDVQRLADMLLVEIHEHLGLLQPSELTAVVWSLGSLVSARKLRADPGLQDEILQAIQGQLPRLSPMQCSNLCWGLAKLQHRLSNGFAEALLLEVQAQLAGFSSSNLCSVLWALAKLGLAPLSPFRQQLWEELQHRIKPGSLGLQDLSTLLWALAQLQLQPPPEVLSELCECSTAQLAACDATHLTNIVWALGRLHARPHRDWLDAAEAASMQVLPSASLKQVVNLAWGLSRLRNPSTAPDSDLDPHSSGTLHAHAATAGSHAPPSAAWQVACLRELRVRCQCAGVEVDCSEMVQLLQDLGVAGLGAGAAAVADQLFAEQQEEACCLPQFQPGCR